MLVSRMDHAEVGLSRWQQEARGRKDHRRRGQRVGRGTTLHTDPSTGGMVGRWDRSHDTLCEPQHTQTDHQEQQGPPFPS